jgi:ATP-dependent DNA helicase RecQ
VRTDRLAYLVGWDPKGWPHHDPLQGVPYFLQQALLALAEAGGLQLEWSEGELRTARAPDYADALGLWPAEAYGRLPLLDPMAPERQGAFGRLLLPFFERALPEPEPLEAPRPGPEHWRLGGAPVGVDALEALQASPRWALAQARRQGLAVRRGDPAWGRWLALGPAALRLWSAAWLARLGAEGPGELRVRVRGDQPLPVLALFDSLELLEAVRRLYGLKHRPPRVRLEADGLGEASLRALRAYAGDPEGRLRRPLLAEVELGPVGEADVLVDDPRDSLLQADWQPDEVLEAARGLIQDTAGVDPGYRITDPAPEVLDHLFSRFFRHPRLRPEQAEAVRRVLAGESLLVLLPTGYGKSAIYQLAALIQPGTALVVSPLVSLILDQVDHLYRDGITGVGFMSGRKHAAGTAEATLEHLRNGRYRLFYVAPERLDLADFRRELGELIKGHRFSLIAVDEAHCASEWGHDFRTSYLHLKGLRQYIEQQGVAERVPMLALTATASPVVRADILRLLGISPDSVVQSRSSDRPELSYSVHVADGRQGYAARLRALDEVLTRVVPAVLGAGEEGLLERDPRGRHRHGAVVFAPFANAHSRAFFASNAAAVAEHLRRDGVLPEGAVGVHSNSAPGRCPRCGSPRYYSDYGRYRCAEAGCGFTGKKDDFASPGDWDERLLEVQTQFLDNRLPVLVSTKGFGMGIDKPNIRLVVHYVMSGSLEGYYQEAGRAGRDRAHAHVALVTVPPDPACAEQHLGDRAVFGLGADDPLPLPCLARNSRGFPALECPYGLEELCDVGQQAYFINQNFPGARDELARLTEAYAGALAGEALEEPPGAGDSKPVEKALSRLRVLEVLRTYTRQGGRTYRAQLNKDWNWARGVDALADYVRSYGEATGTPAAVLAEVEELARSEGDQVEFVQRAGKILIESLYTTIRAMRLAGLRNLYHYAALPPGTCRRVYLRRAFELRLPQDYRCGFCDTCVPDLNFGRERALVPEEATRERVLAEGLERVLTGYDLEALAAYAREVVEAGFVGAVRGRAEYLLEQRPNDLAVLFLAALTAGLEGEGATAKVLAERALEVMLRARMSLTGQLAFVLALGEWLPGLADDLAGDPRGILGRSHPRPALLEALRQLDPARAVWVARAWSLEGLADVAERLGGLLPAAVLEAFTAAVDRAAPAPAQARASTAPEAVPARAQEELDG